MQEASADMGREIEKMMEPSLMRLTKGLPRHELKIIVREAKECESALLEEIKILEKALGMKQTSSTQKESSSSSKSEVSNKEVSSDAKKSMSVPDAAGSNNNAQAATPSSTAASIYGFTGPSYFTTVDAMLQSGLTPPDRFFTVSALFGRLQEPLKISYADSISDSKTKSNNEAVDPKHETKRKETQKLLDKQKVLLALESNPIYTQKQTDPTTLTATWKRISNHRTATVFRRPVNAREAPGYTERIRFPIDLSLIRKMITTGMILSFAELHQRIGLICHNCVKFNGRESDYGIVTRDFEGHVDEIMIAAVASATELAAATSKVVPPVASAGETISNSVATGTK